MLWKRRCPLSDLEDLFSLWTLFLINWRFKADWNSEIKSFSVSFYFLYSFVLLTLAARICRSCIKKHITWYFLNDVIYNHSKISWYSWRSQVMSLSYIRMNVWVNGKGLVQSIGLDIWRDESNRKIYRIIK